MPVVFRARATDLDSSHNGEIEFTIEHDPAAGPAPFAITRHGGDVVATAALSGDGTVDFVETYTLTVVATDQVSTSNPPLPPSEHQQSYI